MRVDCGCLFSWLYIQCKAQLDWFLVNMVEKIHSNLYKNIFFVQMRGSLYSDPSFSLLWLIVDIQTKWLTDLKEQVLAIMWILMKRMTSLVNKYIKMKYHSDLEYNQIQNCVLNLKFNIEISINILSNINEVLQ